MRSDTFRIGLGGGGVEGGDDDDIVTQTPNNISRRTVLLGIYNTFVLSDHLIHIVTKLTSGLCELDLGIAESFLRKLELGRGDACFGDDDDIVLRTPRTICAHTPHTTSNVKSTPSYAEVWALGVWASPFHVQLALFLMFIRCCASGFRSVKNLLGSTCVLHGIHSVFVLSGHLWFSSFFPVEFEVNVRSLRAPKQQFKPQQHSFSTFPHFASNEEKMRSRRDPKRQF